MEITTHDGFVIKEPDHKQMDYTGMYCITIRREGEDYPFVKFPVTYEHTMIEAWIRAMEYIDNIRTIKFLKELKEELK